MTITFDTTPAMDEELQRILAVTDLETPAEVFRRAFTLLRIHVNFALDGREISTTDQDGDCLTIALPFKVARRA